MIISSHTFSQTTEITTEPNDLHVFVNSQFVGRSPVRLNFEKEPQILSIYSSRIRSWNALPVVDTVWKSEKVFSRHYTINNPLPIFSNEVALLRNDKQHSSVSMYLVGAGTILSGSISAYFKLRADHLHQQFLDEYYETGFQNISLRNSVRRNDMIASVSLVLTEIGFMYLAYSLLNF